MEEHDPDVPSKLKMMRRVVADPASQARVFHLMTQLFLKHILGVDISRRRLPADGVASSFFRGLFGVVEAYFAPVETQQRGGLHFHMLVWVANPMDAHVLDRICRGDRNDRRVIELEPASVPPSIRPDRISHDVRGVVRGATRRRRAADLEEVLQVRLCELRKCCCLEPARYRGVLGRVKHGLEVGAVQLLALREWGWKPDQRHDRWVEIDRLCERGAPPCFPCST